MTYYHSFSFFFAIVRDIFITIILFGIGFGAYVLEWPLFWLNIILASIWFVFVFFNVMKAYIDWCFDFILVTTDKIILIDQTSIFKQEIKPIHIENIGGVSTKTQFWNIFPFGILKIHLKEGLGGKDIQLKFVPRVQKIASMISEVVTRYQRRNPAQYVQAAPDQRYPPPPQQQYQNPPMPSPHSGSVGQMPPQGGELPGTQDVQ